jgi:hypothetical protein
MSKIIAKDSFQTGNWDVQFNDINANYAHLYIGFTDTGPVVDFINLSFKFELKIGENIIQYGVYPKGDARYVRSDQEFLTVDHLDLTPETDYNLYLKAENNGQSFERTVSFSTPRHPQPFTSWTWNTTTKVWDPPTSQPELTQEQIDNNNYYGWNEETQSWDLLVDTFD